MNGLTLAIVVFMLVGCAITPSTLDETYFKRTIVIKDDPIQDAIVFSTVKGLQDKQVTTGQVWNDNFLRGFIHKKTGQKTYQVYNVIYYGGSGTKASWKRFKQANYDTLQGIKLTPTTTLKENEDCTSLAVYGQCVYSEHVTFKVDDQVFKTLYRLESIKEWQYTLMSETRESHVDEIILAEIAGLLASMDEYELPKISSGTTNYIDSLNLPEPLVIPPSPEQILKSRKQR